MLKETVELIEMTFEELMALPKDDFEALTAMESPAFALHRQLGPIQCIGHLVATKDTNHSYDGGFIMPQWTLLKRNQITRFFNDDKVWFFRRTVTDTPEPTFFQLAGAFLRKVL